MKKYLLTLVMLLMGSVAWAQSGWTDPSSPSFTSETVVYLAIDCGDYDLYYYNDGYVSSYYEPQVAAFVDGELRDVVTQYVEYPEKKINLYAMRVAGSDADEDKVITFKIYDDRSGIIYSLTEVDGRTVKHGGKDATENLPSEHLTLTFTPAVETRLFMGDVELTEGDPIVIHVKETKYLDNFVAKVYDARGNEIQVETPGVWDIPYGVNSPYVQQVESEDGSAKIKGMKVTPEDEATGMNRPVRCGHYVVGSLAAPIWVRVLPEYIPVTSIAIEDVNLYWKGSPEGMFIGDDMVVYNNGESTPTNPGIKIISSSNPDIAEPMRDAYLSCKGIGSSEITVVALDDESANATFTVNVLSGLNGIRIDGENPYHCMRYTAEEEYLKLPMVSFDWVNGEDGAPVVGDAYEFEDYTMTSSNTDILRIDGMDVISLKKGTAVVTYTSNYDPTKTAELTVIVGQSLEDVKITKVGATEVITSPTHETIIDIAVGQEVTAVAQVNPADADYESFILEIVDPDGIPFDEKMVEIGETVVQDGTCEFTFTFTSVPDRDVILKAVVDGQWQDRVLLNVIQSVVSITPIPEEITLWLTEEEFGQHTGTIDVTVLPEDATDKSLTVSSSDDDIVSIELTDNVYTYTVNNKGTATLTFISNDNPSASAECVITVKKKVTDLMVDAESLELYNDGMTQEVNVTVYPTDADYNLDNLTVRVETGSDMVPTNWEFVTIDEYGAIDGGKQYGITGRSLNINGLAVLFSYDTTEQGDEEAIGREIWTRVKEKVNLHTGWNWVSFISAGISPYEMESSLEEARSQTSLIINDPNWGLFGNLGWMDSYEAYKIKMKEEAEMLEYILTEGKALNENGYVDDKILEHGWNWVSYPYEYEYAVEEIFDATQFNEGDIILSKEDGMVTLTDGAWEGNLTSLIPNQGYLIYSNTEGEYSVTMPNRYELEQGEFRRLEEAQQRDRSVWSYDGSRFANTMAIIGTFNIEDAADYTIGAFVGDECRGEGKFVNGRAYITAAGEAGEVVTLRLYNTWTGEYFDVAEEVAFTDLAGSVKAPVRFNAGTTAIDNLSSDALTIQGHVATADGTIQVLDVQGKVVAEGYQRIDFSHLGQGVYVVKAGEASRKVIK